MGQKNVIVLKNAALPKEEGRYARLLCLTGVKKGENYFFKSDRIVLGRGEQTDIQIHDMKTSREHAEIKKVGQEFVITDLGSQNGVIINDLRVTQYSLKDGDRLILGQTVYKYSLVKIDSQNNLILGNQNKLAAKKNPGQNQNQNQNQKNEAGINFNDDHNNQENFDFNSDQFSDEEDKKKKKNRTLVALVILIAGGVFFLSEDKGEGENIKRKEFKSNTKDITDEFSNVLRKKKNQEDRELDEKLSAIFQRGLREAREGNYFRAISEFNLALILSPQNSRASFYLNKTNQKLNEEIEQHFIHARRAYDALKYDTAMSSYCSIVRLLQNMPDDDRYKTAIDNIKEIEKRMGLDEGETKCI